MAEPIPISDRARGMPASPIRRLAPLAVAAAAAGKHVHSLNIGQPDIPAPAEMLARLRDFDERNVAYGPSEGLPEFVTAILGSEVIRVRRAIDVSGEDAGAEPEPGG